MASDSNSSDASVITSPSSRIKDLNAIDKDLAHLLQSASQAIRALTAPPSQASSSTADTNEPVLQSSRRAFESNTTDFLTTIQAVSARLRRQTYALEEAGITAPEAEVVQGATAAAAMQGATSAGAGAQQQMQVTNGGLGSLDVGWLNARRDEVGRQKEAELWAEARGRLENLHETDDGVMKDRDGDMGMADEQD